MRCNGILRTLHSEQTDKNGAGGGIRTRDLNLGKVALYQLSYTRNITNKFLISDLANITKWYFNVNRKEPLF